MMDRLTRQTQPDPTLHDVAGDHREQHHFNHGARPGILPAVGTYFTYNTTHHQLILCVAAQLDAIVSRGPLPSLLAFARCLRHGPTRSRQSSMPMVSSTTSTPSASPNHTAPISKLAAPAQLVESTKPWASGPGTSSLKRPPRCGPSTCLRI